jgi:hypothetical protein
MKIIYVDIDETICETPADRDYNKSVPITENIAKINRLFEEGNTIVYWTARGSRSGIDWYELTESQLKVWGVKYNRLFCDKPYYDLFVDDKCFNMEDI